MELIYAQAVRRAVCNVDIPEGVTEEQFYAVMNNVAEAVINCMKGWKGETVEYVRKLPTIEAVPVHGISVWLAAYAAPPKYAIDEIAGTDPDRIVTADTLVKAWEYHWKNLMDCGLMEEGNEKTRPRPHV